MMRSMARTVVGVVLILAVAWGGLWWYAQERLQAGIRGWIAQNTSNGAVQITYDSIVRGHSPFAADVTLINPRWSIQPAGASAPVTLSTPSFGLRIGVANPLVVHVDVARQILVGTPKGDISITYGSLDITEHLNPKALFDTGILPFRSFTTTASDMSLLAGNGIVPVLHIGSFAEHGSVNPQAGPKDIAYAADLTLQDLSSPTLPVLMALAGKGTNVPFDNNIKEIALSTTLSGPVPADWKQQIAAYRTAALGPDKNKILIENLHNWALQGGTGTAGLTLAVGPSTLNVNGNLAFDGTVQPNGTADITADHLDAFTATLTSAVPQLQGDISSAEAVLSPYLSTTAAGGQVLNAHVAYGKAGVLVNGERKADMPPLDWAALENPPAQAVQAPGDGSGAGSTGP
jgi:hypothetical protein